MRGVPSSIANAALTVGVVFALAFAIGFTVRYPIPTKSPAPAESARDAIHLQPTAAETEPAPTQARAPLAVSVATPPGRRVGGRDESFDPPPPAMADMAGTETPPRNLEIAALPAPEFAATPSPAAPVPTTRPAIRTKASPAPEIRLPSGDAEEADTAQDTDEKPTGRPLGGPAVVTAALELNVAGKPLRLAGVRLPVATDLCVLETGYAARSCADVTRQALAARIGAQGEVSCQVLSGDGPVQPAVCKGRDGEDLAAYLIEHGFALAGDAAMIDYSAAETRARTARSGLWSYR